MALKLDILANTRQFVGEMKKAGSSTEDISDALDDMARDGAKAGDKLERTFRDMATDAKKADKAVEKIGDSGGKGFSKASEASKEFKQEALANFSEVTSSFDGSMSSITDLAQGTLGGLASGLAGPLGLAAGGIAVGVGGIIAAFTQAETHRAELQARAGDLASAYIDAGTNVLDALTVASRASEILTDPERTKEAEALARVLEVDLATATRALAGDQNALTLANRIVRHSEEELDELRKKTAVAGQYTAADIERLNLLEEQASRMADVQKVTGDANKTFEAQQDVLKGLITDAEGATVQVGTLGDTLYTLPDGTEIVIQADTGQATTAVQQFEDEFEKATKTKVAKVTLKVDDQATGKVNQIIRDISGKVAKITVNAPGKRQLLGG